MRYLALVVMLGFCLRGWGQDTIVLANKSKMLVKVLKVTEYGIKYAKWEDSTGSKHNLDISQVLKIKYSDGRIEVFDQNTGAVYWVHRPEPNTDSIERAQQSFVHRPDANSYKFIGQDTLFLNDNTELAVRVVNVVHGRLTYLIWNDHIHSEKHIPVSAIRFVKYEDGTVATRDEMLDGGYWKNNQKINPYVLTYDSLMRLGRIWTIPGSISMGLALPGLFGFIPMANDASYGQGADAQSLIRGGYAVLGFGIFFVISGPIELIVSGVYKFKARKMKYGALNSSSPIKLK